MERVYNIEEIQKNNAFDILYKKVNQDKEEIPIEVYMYEDKIYADLSSVKLDSEAIEYK